MMRGHKSVRFLAGSLLPVVLAGAAGCPMESREADRQPALGRRFLSPIAPGTEVKSATETSGAAESSFPEGVPGADVMAQKLNDAIAVLTDQGPNPAPGPVAEAAINQGMEALFMSNLVILPSAGVPDAEAAYSDNFLPMAQSLVDALSTYIGVNISPYDHDADGDVDLDDFNAFEACRSGPTLPVGPGCGYADVDHDEDVDQDDFGDHQRHRGFNHPEETVAAAYKARNFVQVFMEASQVVANHTRVCDPQNPNGLLCQILQADDESGVVVDNIVPGFSRQVRGPFIIADAGAEGIQEQVIAPDSIAPGDCAVVVKEVQGVKAVIRPVLIPIWVEPWFARASIVGFQTVWVWEFIPAEFIKSISYCNNAGIITETVQIRTIIERELLQFWSFPRKEISGYGDYEE